MSNADGRVVIDIIAQDKQAQKSVDGMGRRLINLAKAAAGAFAVRQIMNFTNVLAQAANQLRMVDRQFNTTFGSSASVARANIDRISDSIGMLPGRTEPIFTRFVQSWQMAGKSMEDSMAITEQMINISADAAANFGKSFDDASGALQSFMKGNTMAGLALGINTSQAEIQQWALENLGLEWERLDEAQRKVARMEFAQAQFDNARITGMAAESSRDLTNVLGNLQHAWLMVKGALGEVVIDRVTDGFIWLTNVLVSTAEFIPVLIEWFGGLIETLSPFAPIMYGVIAAFVAFKVIKTVSGMITTFRGALLAARTAAALATAAQGANNMMMVASQAQLAAVTKSQLAYQLLLNKFPKTMALAKKAKLAWNIVTAAGSLLGTAATVVFGLMTGTMTLLTAKTLLAAKAKAVLNAVMMMNPFVAVAAGIGVLVAGTIALVAWFRRGGEEARELRRDTEALNDRIEDHAQAMEASAQAHEENIRAIGVQQQANTRLAGSVQNLADTENRSATQRGQLRRDIAALNEAIPGLALAYDTETGALNMSNEELERRINLHAEQQRGLAAQERQTEIMREQNEIAMQREEINILEERAIELHGENSRQVRDLRASYAELGESYDELGALYEANTIIMEEAQARLTAMVEDGTWAMEVAWEELSGAQQDAVESMIEMQGRLESQTVNSMERINTEVERCIEEHISIFEHNAAATERWGENMTTMYARTAELGFGDGFVAYIERRAEECHSYLEMLVNATDDELGRLYDGFNATGDAVDGAMTEVFGSEFEEVLALAERFGPDVAVSMRQGLEDADFPGMGTYVTDGVAEGIENGADDVYEAVDNVATHSIEYMANSLGINSPSRYTIPMGEYMSEGIAVGLENGEDAIQGAIDGLASTVLDSSESMTRAASGAFDNMSDGISRSITDMQRQATRELQQLTRTFNNHFEDQRAGFRRFSNEYRNNWRDMLTRVTTTVREGNERVLRTVERNNQDIIRNANRLTRELTNAGRDAMRGLNQGLLNGRDQVMNTARSIANQVAATMRDSLRINSPSRVMRDDIGRPIIGGIVKGIRDDSNLVSKELQRIPFDIKLPKFKPEAMIDMGITASGVSSSQADRTAQVREGEARMLANMIEKLEQALGQPILLDGEQVATFADVQLAKKQIVSERRLAL